MDMSVVYINRVDLSSNEGAFEIQTYVVILIEDDFAY